MSGEAERWREVRVGTANAPRMTEAGDALAAALKARDRRIAELEAGVRRIADETFLPPDQRGGHESAAVGIARDLLAGRAAGGEG